MSPGTYEAGQKTLEANLEQARESLQRYYGEEQVSYDSDQSFSDEVIRERGVFGPSVKVEENLSVFVEVGVERFVVRFTADNQREQLKRFAPIVAST